MIAALSTAAFTACYTVVDGSGARRAGDPLAFIVWLFVLGGIGTVVWNLSRQTARTISPSVKQIYTKGKVRLQKKEPQVKEGRFSAIESAITVQSQVGIINYRYFCRL